MTTTWVVIDSVHILLIQIDFQIPASQSLKDKRSVLKGLIDRLRTRHNVCVAEVENHDKWQLATLAVITVSNMRDRVEATALAVEQEIEGHGEVLVVAYDRQWL